MKTVTLTNWSRRAAVSGAVAVGLGATVGGTPVLGDTLFFGDDGNAPFGDFELTTGSLGGANYYSNTTHAGGNSPLAADTLHIGNNATVTHDSGTVIITSIRVGPAPGSNPLDAADAVIAYPKNGTLNITGGFVETAGTGTLSFSIGDGNTGSVNVSGDAGVTVYGRTTVGVAGPAATLDSVGTLTISENAQFFADGTDGLVVGGQRMRGHVTLDDNAQLLVENGPLTIGSHDLGGSTLTVNGGTLIVGTDQSNSVTTIGAGAGGGHSLSINGGQVTLNGPFNVGTAAGDNNSVTISDGELTVKGDGAWLRVGASAQSTGNVFTQTGGTVNAIGLTSAGESLLIAGPAGSGASYSISGGIFNVAGTAQVGNFGHGQFTASGATISFGELNIANGADSTGSFSVIGGDASISVANRFTIGVGDDDLPQQTGGLGTLSFATDANGEVSIIDITAADGVAIFGDSTLVVLDGSAAPGLKPVYDLLTASEIVANLDAVTFDGPAGYFLQISSGLRGQVLQAVVPEPGVASVLAMAGGYLALRRRRA